MRNFLSLKYITALFVIATFSFSSCTSDSDGDANDTDTTAVDANTPETHLSGVNISTAFKLPSPVELYMFLWETNARFNKDALNPIDKAGKYLTTSSKAINLGIYSSDLAYCTVFGKNQETFTYFSSTKKLAEDLGLTEGFDEAIAGRLEANVNNSDSLFQITNDSYSDVTRYLESQGQGDLLPLIVAGGWIESVYINVNSVDDFNNDNEIAILLADQGILLETLVEYFNSIEDKSDEVNAILNDFMDLQESFDKLYDNLEDEIITEAQFDEIGGKIEKIRNGFVK